MKLALICPSNRLYMPYVKNYEHILIEQKIDYDILNWDRFQIEAINENTYRDRKVGHQRNFIDYMKYKKFLYEKINTNQYDKIIVFGIQLSYILNHLLYKKYKGRYGLDIRDYHILIHFFSIKKIIERASFVVISSSGFTQWLPPSDQYVINHNIQISGIDELNTIDNIFEKEIIKIANIGAIRDLSIQRDLIRSLKNNCTFKLHYHGEGGCSQDILRLIEDDNIKNAVLTGRYYPQEEALLYKGSDLINVLRYNDGINNKTALPNRLYHAVLYGKPLLAHNGTYLAEVILCNGIGMVLDSFEDVEKDILQYISQFDAKRYNRGREKFMENVIQDNKCFEGSLRSFLK